MKALLTCGCGAVPTYVQAQYKIKHPKEEIPTLYISRKGYKFLDALPPNSEAHRFVAAILKKRGRYAYSIDANEDGTLNEVYDFMKKKRVA